jgi:hypothetical protein
MKRIFLALAVLVFASLACNAVSSGTNNPPTQPSNQSASTPVPQNPSGQVLFQDDFSDPNSGWPADADTDKSASYSNGQYLLQALSTKQDVWAHPGQSFGDVRVEVDATKSSGPEDNSFGLVCRFVDNDNFYFFVVSSDGYQAIGKYQAGQVSYLSADKMQSTSNVKSGTATNHLRADCIGSTLTLYINGQQTSSVTDSSFSTGDVGVIVGTFDTPNVGILFDNFVVYKP